MLLAAAFQAVCIYKEPSGCTHIGIKAISLRKCYIVIVTLAAALVICLKCMPKVQGRSPRTLGIHFRQITLARFIKCIAELSTG